MEAAILMSLKFANKSFDATLTQVPNPSSNLRFPEIVTETDPAQPLHSQAILEEISAGTFCTGNTNLFLPNYPVGCVAPGSVPCQRNT